MRIYVLPPDYKGSEHYTVKGKDVHYLTKVLRLREKSHFTGRDSFGTLWDLTMESISKQACLLTCKKHIDKPSTTTDTLPEFRGPFPEIHLYQSICKGKKMDQIIRQATELGVQRIIPVQSQFSVVDLTGKEDERTLRYEAIVKEAIQQSGSPVMTHISPPITCKDIAEDWNHRGTACVLHQVAIEQQQDLFTILKKHCTHTPEKPFGLVIGPEGGFSDDEVASLIHAGVYPILLKTNILRAETAAIASLAIVQHYLVDSL